MTSSTGDKQTSEMTSDNSEHNSSGGDGKSGENDVDHRDRNGGRDSSVDALTTSEESTLKHNSSSTKGNRGAIQVMQLLSFSCNHCFVN